MSLNNLVCARSSTDRVSDYGSEGWGFESLRARLKLKQLKYLTNYTLSEYENFMREINSDIKITDISQTGDVPVGCLLFNQFGKRIAYTFNKRKFNQDPTAHAEVLAIRQAAKQISSWCLYGYTLIVNLEPCAMCAGAIVAARLARVVFGAWNESGGAAGSYYDILRDGTNNHMVEVLPGVLANDCQAVLSNFFKTLRK